MPTIVDILKYQLVLDDSQFKAGAAQADASANQLAGTLGGTLTAAVGMLAAAFGALKIGEFLKDATMTAARTEVLGTVLNVVGKNAGVSQGQLALLEEQVKSLGITTQGARESIIKFIQSGLPLAKVAELARLSQDSAVIAGINSAEALDRLVRGIQTGQIELIRSAGVFVSIEQELNKFAKTTGKAREGITDLERQTVILNAVLAQGEKLAGNYEAAMGDVGKQMTSLPRFFEELQNAIGTFFLPVMEDAVKVLGDLLKATTDLVTNDSILNARKALGTGDVAAQQERLNQLYEARRTLTAQIAQNDIVSNQLLTANVGAASLVSNLVNKGLGYATDKQKRDLAEIERLIKAIGAAQDEAFVGPTDDRAAFATKQAEAAAAALAAKEEARAKRALERGKELAKTITIGGDIAEGMDKQWQKFLAEISGAPIEAQVKITIPTAEAAAVKQQIQDIVGATGGDAGPMFDILDVQQQIDDARRIADATEAEFRNAFDNVFTIASGVLRNIGNEAADVFGGMLATIGNFSTGNWASGIVGVFDSLFSVFGGGTDKLVLSQRDLIRAIEDWQQTVSSISDRDKAEQQNAITQAMQFAQRQNELGWGDAQMAGILDAMLTAAGVNTPENATLQQLIAFMQALQLTLADTSRSFESIIGATTAGQRTGLVTGTTGADEALRLIGTLTDIFDLSLEEQQALLQRAFDDLVARGLLSDQDKADFFARIEGLGDSIDSMAEKGGTTQVERSIARVSERQADSLISIMNTIDLHLTDGLNTLIDYVQGLLDIGQQMVAGAAIGGGNYTIEITNNFTGGNQAEIESTVSKAVEKGIRAVGGTRLGSR